MFDVAVIGAGPAGLALAISLGMLGLEIAVIEKQSLSVLRDPPPDGREIALSHRARRIMTGLGIWDCLNPDDLSPILEAQVANGVSGSRRATLPIYLATNALIKLFTDDSVPARLARSGRSRRFFYSLTARHAPPFKWWVTNQLLGE